MLKKTINLLVVTSLLLVTVFLSCDKEEMESSDMTDGQSMLKCTMSYPCNSYGLPTHGSALYFDGVNDFVRVPHNPSLDMTHEFTITAWVNLAEFTEWASIVTKGGLPWSYSIEHNNNYAIQQGGPTPGLGSEYGRFCLTHDCVIFSIPLPQTNTSIALNEWHHVAVVFADTLAKFYLDGNPDGQYTVWSPICTNEEPLNIGADFPGGHEYWHGMIDEIKIWNKPLKLQHIRAAMHLGATPMAYALSAYWNFDEGRDTIVHDRSRYRNNGVLIGRPTWVRAKH
jgi:hypothetical protein